jgi:pantoate--beta-alanine ligase
MIVVSDKKNLQKSTDEFRAKNKKIGLVPTMGALHAGHKELVKRCISENDISVCSIFVNPTQFNNKEDLINYPKTPEKDIELLAQAGCDIVFMPDVGEMYPESGPANNKINISLGYLDEIMEGKFRPGHFMGVATIVHKLIGTVKPDRAYFGEKDYQQLLVIHTLVKQLSLPTKIIPCPIVREKDGLAMSSRNTRLTFEERKQAPFIYEQLRFAKEKAGKIGVGELLNIVNQKFSENPFFSLEYFEIADKNTLSPVEKWINTGVIACVAAQLGKVRLIDNMVIFP